MCVEGKLHEVVAAFSHYEFPQTHDCHSGLDFQLFSRQYAVLKDEAPAGAKNPSAQAGKKGEEEKPWHFVIKDPKGESTPILFKSEGCTSKEFAAQLLKTALKFGHQRTHYRLTPDKCGWELFWICEGEVQVIGRTNDLCCRKRLMDLFMQIANAEGFHAIEHILLRPRAASDHFLPIHLPYSDEQSAAEIASLKEILIRDPYSFRMTVVLPAWSWRFEDMQFRCFVETVLRREAPAHILLNIIWIGLCQMQEFEPCYVDWLTHLRALPEGVNGHLPYAPPAELPEDYEETYGRALNKLTDALQACFQEYPTGILSEEGPEASKHSGITLGKSSLGTL
ncbi:MAG: hypothetical protein D6730_20610 [Bacteroidetes bacterium]|nr:MAG: hypothetical protein D6730_20610 [Bacteroidota bacterium]